MSQASNVRRTKLSIDLTVETAGMSAEEHGRRVRWTYRNMLTTNADLDATFYVATVRDENGELLEFTGAGRGKPSAEIKKLIAALMEEKA